VREPCAPEGEPSIVEDLVSDHFQRLGLSVFSTCPSLPDLDRGAYLERIIDVSTWSERHGYEGILVYTDNGRTDPWLVSQIIVQSTERLCPLVAVQPVYMHPHSVAKMVSSLGHMHGRRLHLNLVAGGFKRDLEALGDPTKHDDRYARLVEYASIIKRLLGSASPVSYAGQFYEVTNLKLAPPLPRGLMPGLFVSGSSEAALSAAAALEATPIAYPPPPGEGSGAAEGAPRRGARIGLIARRSDEEAWAAARARFPEDRKGQLCHQLANKVTDSVWHHQLSEVGARSAPMESPYWLGPLQNYQTFCPYLVGAYVGAYETVAQEIARYIAGGHRVFILDVPPDERELQHIDIAFSAVERGAS
jgi:alkanesulfonate monooxygenase